MGVALWSNCSAWTVYKGFNIPKTTFSLRVRHIKLIAMKSFCFYLHFKALHVRHMSLYYQKRALKKSNESE